MHESYNGHASPSTPNGVAAPPRPTFRYADGWKDRIPGELKALPQWVVWRFEFRDGKWTKVLYQPLAAARKAKANTPATWARFDQAVAAHGRDSRFDGVGFVFSADDPYCGIDADDSIGPDGEVKGWAREVLDPLMPGYFEISPSGRGIKGFVRAELPGKGTRRTGFGPDGKGAVELYDRLRFFTVTGDVVARDGAGIEDRSAPIRALYQRITTREKKPSGKEKEPSGPAVPTLDLEDDDDLIKKARAARNGAKFESLFDRGDASGYNGDESAADFALCKLIGFWTGNDPARVERIFDRSALADRDKWKDRADYRALTIANALDGAEFYTPPAPSAGRIARPEAPTGKKAPRPAKVAALEGAGYIVSDRGNPLSCVFNTLLWLKENKPADHIRYDTFRRTILIGGEPLTDRAVIALVAEIEESTRRPWRLEHVYSSIQDVAHRNEFSSLAQYLESLQWDGEPRIEWFFSDHFGVADNEYHREVARVFFLSAVARGLRPGCKVDTVPILIGPQGAGKSRSAAALCPDPAWFTDQLNGDLGSKEASEGLRGKFLVELGELAAMRKSELEATKAFLSRDSDHYRPPYGKVPEDFPRTCVFVATTNDDAPLQDLENRRFLPVRGGGVPVDIRAIATARDQLWAEAVRRFKSGEEWWTTSSQLETELRREVGTARAADAWEDALAESLETTDRVTMQQAALRLGVETSKLGRSEQIRIGNALKAIGFVRRREPNPPRAWYYERGPSQPELGRAPSWDESWDGS